MKQGRRVVVEVRCPECGDSRVSCQAVVVARLPGCGPFQVIVPCGFCRAELCRTVPATVAASLVGAGAVDLTKASGRISPAEAGGFSRALSSPGLLESCVTALASSADEA